jgi:hypothetical protein
MCRKAGQRLAIVTITSSPALPPSLVGSDVVSEEFLGWSDM